MRDEATGPAKVYEKSLCVLCRYSFHDQIGNLGCIRMVTGKIRKDILTADANCRKFERRRETLARE